MQVTIKIVENGQSYELPVPHDKAQQLVNKFKQEGLLTTNTQSKKTLVTPGAGMLNPAPKVGPLPIATLDFSRPSESGGGEGKTANNSACRCVGGRSELPLTPRLF